MKLKIYEPQHESKPEKRWPLLCLRTYKILSVSACTESGAIIADLFGISDCNLLLRFENAKGALEGHGFGTDFAEWDEKGRIVKLKPGVLDD